MTSPRSEYTPEKVAELVEEARKRAGAKWKGMEGSTNHLVNSMADALTAVAAERDAATKRARQAWEVIDSDYWRNTYDDSMARGNAYVAVLRNRIRATLRALRVVTAERDRLHKAITEALELLQPNAFFSGPKPELTTLDLVGSRRILRAALDKEGNDDE